MCQRDSVAVGGRATGTAVIDRGTDIDIEAVAGLTVTVVAQAITGALVIERLGITEARLPHGAAKPAAAADRLREHAVRICAEGSNIARCGDVDRPGRTATAAGPANRNPNRCGKVAATAFGLLASGQAGAGRQPDADALRSATAAADRLGEHTACTRAAGL